MNILSILKRRIMSLLYTGLLVSVAAPDALATDLPSGVLNYLRQKDPHVKVRFDGLVQFSNGESYVPVMPQETSFNADSQQVVATIPAKAAFPDLVQFDNNFFLMRLIQTASGRLTFPKMTDYPIQLKEGLLPQDFVMPSNLYIPVELKVILGALPYNPSFSPVQAPVSAPIASAPVAPAATTTLQNVYSHQSVRSVAPMAYVFDLSSQKIMAIELSSGRKQAEVALDCAPSSLRLSPDGKLLFVPCLSTNELVAVDTGSNLVKTRVNVGQRPDGVLYLPQTQDVVVSNRYSPFLSLVNSNNLIGEQKISLPGNGGAMAIVPGARVPKIVVADAFKPQIYLVDINTRVVEKTWAALSDISGLQVFQNAEGGLEVWAVSRTKNQLIAIDGTSGTILKTLDVGEKPVDLGAYEGKLFVVSAGSDRVDVIDRLDRSKYGTIALESGSFPSGIAMSLAEKRAYLTLAAAQNFVTIHLDTLQVDKSAPVEFRASMIAITPDKAELEQSNAKPSGLDRSQKLKPMDEASSQGVVTPSVQKQQPNIKQVQAEAQKSKKSKKALKAETQKLNIKKAKTPKPEKSVEASTNVKKNQQPSSATVPQPGLPGAASGKFQLKLLGRDKATHPASAKPSPEKTQTPIQTQPTSIQVQANKNTKPLAMPLDLEVSEPSSSGASGSKGASQPIQTQGDVLKK